MKHLILIAAALLSLSAPALAQTRALPPGEIRANGDITFGNALKLGKREGDKIDVKDDLAVGAALLRDALASNVLTRLSAAQIADVRSGAAALDLAPALNAALNNCGPSALPPTIRFPAGVYSIKSPLKAQTCAVNVVLEAGATIRQTGPFPLGDTVDNLSGLIMFTGNAHGSSLSGSGTIDGNRNNPALLAAFLAGPRSVQENGLYVMKSLWDCVSIGGVNDVTVEGVTMRNCMMSGIQRSSNGARARISNVRILDSTIVLGANNNTGDVWENITAQNIGNVVNGQAIPTFAYAMNFFTQFNLTVNGVTLDGYQTLVYDGTPTTPGVRIGDPGGAVIFFQRLDNGTISGITGRNLNFDMASDKRRTSNIYGTFCDNCVNVTMSDLSFTGTRGGILVSGSKGVSVSNFVVDGLYNVAPVAGHAEAFGVAVLPISQEYSLNATANSSYDFWNMHPNAGIAFSNGTIRRSELGFVARTGNFTANNIESTANTLNGFTTIGSNRGSSFPASALFPVKDFSVSNFRSTYNAGAGFQVGDSYNGTFSNIVSNNNGQDDSNSVPYGIWVTPGVNGVSRNLFFNGWQANDDQAAATVTVSFAPGSSTAGGIYKVVAETSTDLHVGQKINIVNGGGSGSNIVGRIEDITADALTLRTSAASTFNDASCRVAQTGTVSLGVGSSLMTGSGTNFRTSIVGPSYMRVAGQYIQIVSVVSDTVLQVRPTASSPISNAPFEIVKCSAQGVASQRRGLTVDAAAGVTGVSLGNPSAYRAVGNLDTNISLGAAQRYDEWIPYTPTVRWNAGTGLSASNVSGRYKLDGRTMCMQVLVTTTYTAPPDQVIVSVPPGFLGFGSLTGANTDTYNTVRGFLNLGNPEVALLASSGSLFTASGQRVVADGCFYTQ